jgi:hypothetical protein
MLKFIEYISKTENISQDDLIKELKMIHKVILSKGKKEWDGRHYGDCTKQNISCVICSYQNWLASYEDYTKDFIRKKYSIPDKDIIPVSNEVEYVGNNVWNTKPPKTDGDFICRMSDSYIKMCHWNGSRWLDMWDDKLNGSVKEWMYIPYDRQ